MLQNIDDDISVTEMKQALTNLLSDYVGVSGFIVIDQNGDRINGRFDFWGISNESEPGWFLDFYYEDGMIIDQ